MSWDDAVPAGTDLLSTVDNVIREMKTDVETALSEEGIFPGAAPATPVFKWTGKRGNTAGRPASPETGEIYFNTQLFQMEYWGGAAWTAYDMVPLLGITTAKINDLAVTNAKINDVATTKLTGTIADAQIAGMSATKLIGLILNAQINSVEVAKITGTLPIASGGTAKTTKLISMKQYTGNGTNNTPIAHGLGATPDLVLIIRTDSAAGNAPAVWHSDMGAIVRWTSGGAAASEINSVDSVNVTLGTGYVNLAAIPYVMFTFKTQ